MYGTREELCTRLTNMFAADEQLVVLVWTEEGIGAACRTLQPEPDVTEIRDAMKAIGAMKMVDYRREGVTNTNVSEIVASQRAALNRRVSVPAGLLSRVLRDYRAELEHRVGIAWGAGCHEPQSVREALNDVHALQDALAA